MLYFSRIEAAAIIITVLVVCSFAVPNFLSDQTVRGWPDWAQRRLVLGPDLQGGTSIVLEVDRSDVRAQLLESVRLDVHTELRDAGVKWASVPRVRGDSVEVRLNNSGYAAGFAKLRELSQPFNGVRPLDVVDAGDGLIRLTPTEDAITEREQQTINQSIPVIEKRISESGLVTATVQRQGNHRILFQVPGGGDPRWPLVIPSMMSE